MKKEEKKWFTLIEVIVSLTILSLILVSVLTIFNVSSRMSLTADINRAMQENVKNIVEQIAEDIRNNGINICNGWGSDCYDFSAVSGNYITSEVLYIWWNTYYLAKESTSWWFVQASIGDCEDIKAQCVLVKNGASPLSNSRVNISNLSFEISKKYIPKVTIHFEMRPSIYKWIPSSYIENSRLIFQTTISERIIETK